MRNILLCGALISAAYAACSTSVFAADLVSDGTFTSPAIHAGVNTFLGGGTFGPWAVTGASIDVVGNDTFQAPPGGGNVVDLSGLAPGGISQTLSLTTGDTYQLSFFLSGNPDGSPNDKKLTVSIGNLDQNLHFTLKPGSNGTHMNYELETLTFTANGDNLLSFVDDGPKNSAFGAVIGDVSVLPVSGIPEPATWTIFLAGFGALGFVMQSRKKRSNALRIA